MNARINLIGQGMSSDGHIRIDRAMPAILHDRMGQGEWNSFCERVDAILTEVGPVHRKLKCAFMMQVLVTLIMFAVIAATSATGVLFRNSSYFAVLPVVFIFVPYSLFICTIKPIITRIRTVFDDLNRLCAEESSKYSDVSFHLREERTFNRSRVIAMNYIECVVSVPYAFAIGSSNVVPAFNNFPIATQIHPSTHMSEGSSMFSQLASNNGIGERSSAERLRDLEGIRSLITEEEYLQKKREILAGM